MPADQCPPARPSGDRPGRAYLRQLLGERNQYPERAAAIDALVYAAFNRKVAILALDMCGFTREALAHGIVNFLAMIHQMEQAAAPAVTGNGGQVIKQDADNLFAIFAAPAHALEAALDILRSFAAMNAVRPDESGIYASIGIGFGDTLVIESHDLFGGEMNAACKLGEDLAGRMEILLTRDAFAALPADHYRCTEEHFPVAGIDLQCYRYDATLLPRPSPAAVR